MSKTKFNRSLPSTDQLAPGIAQLVRRHATMYPDASGGRGSDYRAYGRFKDELHPLCCRAASGEFDETAYDRAINAYCDATGFCR